MSKTPEEFYNQLADNYSLIFSDWQESVYSQGKIISKIVGDKNLNILDCSCGIGTQAIGLALNGHTVHATDISSKEIEKAKEAAIKMKADLTFGVADFRDLDNQVSGCYEAIISFDNSLPHLLTDSDLIKALSSMRNKLVQNGQLFISIRDYDKLLEEKPNATTPQVIKKEEDERIYFQIWRWDNKLPIYETSVFILNRNNNNWSINTSSTMYRALRRDELTNLLIKTGYKDIKWLEPEQTSYYQPIVTATK